MFLTRTRTKGFWLQQSPSFHSTYFFRRAPPPPPLLVKVEEIVFGGSHLHLLLFSFPSDVSLRIVRSSLFRVQADARTMRLEKHGRYVCTLVLCTVHVYVCRSIVHATHISPRTNQSFVLISSIYVRMSVCMYMYQVMT